eukprot:143586-Amorphochlora_amoeboformis.AAC.1
MTPIRAFILYLMAVAACGANICSPRDTGLMGNNLAVSILWARISPEYRLYWSISWIPPPLCI